MEPIEHRKEYQLNGYEYLRAELFNNIRVGGPRDSQDESCGMINVTRRHERHGRRVYSLMDVLRTPIMHAR